jgi:methylated-DNA-[protein]-cysteine S-methyltransferase
MKTNDLKHVAERDEAERRSKAAAEALANRAESDHLLDVAVGSVGSPVGDLLVAVTPRGIVRVAFQGEGRDRVLGELASSISPRILESAARTDEVRRELDEYFDGRRDRFDLKVDRRLVHGLQRDVLSATARIPFGRTSTYGQIARTIGHPSAARAVGRALGANPIPIVIPCHRVIGASGSLTGYGGGLHRKEFLLTLEGAILM